MTTGHVAVIDIGKTNAKLALVDSRSMTEVSVITRPNTVLPGPPWPHFDVDGHWAFLLDGLSQFNRDHGISAISVTTHGASGVLLDANGDLAAPVLDYEHTGPDQTAAAYDAIRPAFEETGAPRLPMGLNLGAQLFWMFDTDPGLAARTHRVMTYPQYWGFRLTGVAASDVSSLGCHTDLWAPYDRSYSSLVGHLGLSGKMAAARRSFDVLGPILPDLAAQTGLAGDLPVYCGIHDSNASLLPHILGREAPFSVVSTGTWVIVMSMGGRDVALDPDRDTLVNVNALGDPVPSARFMGGREFETVIAGQFGTPEPGDIARVLETPIILCPAVVPGCGPFPNRTASWIGGEPPHGSGARTVAVSFYLALMTAKCLDLIGHRGPVVVEGPFSGNLEYRQMLCAATGCPVISARGATGTSIGAAMLAGARPTHWPDEADATLRHAPDDMQAYSRRWAAATAGL